MLMGPNMQALTDGGGSTATKKKAITGGSGTVSKV